MKRKTFCLLLAGMMTLSLLSGCGSSGTGAKDDGTQNSALAATDVGGPAETGGQDAPEQSTPEQSAPAAGMSNPLFDKFAVQFHDVTIKPGMTLGEAVEAVQKSELPLVLSPDYPGSDEISEFDPKELDQELTVPGIKTGTFQSGEHEGQNITYQEVRDKSLYLYCDGGYVFSIRYYTALPGEEGTTYRMRDLPLVGTNVSGNPEYGDEIHTWLGTAADIKRIGETEIEAVFADTGAELTSEVDEQGHYIESTDQYEPRTNYRATIYHPFSWNGYEILDGGYVYHSFTFDLDGNMESWSISNMAGMPFWVVKG